MHNVIKKTRIISIILVLLLVSTTTVACSKHGSSSSQEDGSTYSNSSSSSDGSFGNESSGNEDSNSESTEETSGGFGGSLIDNIFGESSGFGNSSTPDNYWKFTYRYDLNRDTTSQNNASGASGTASTGNTTSQSNASGATGTTSTGITTSQNTESCSIDDTIYIIQKRISEYTTDGSVWHEGNDTIMVALPPVENMDKVSLAEALIADSNIYFIRQYSSDGRENYYFHSLDDSGRASYSLSRSIEELIESGDVVVESKDIKKAEAQTRKNDFGTTEFIVAISLGPEGSEKFAIATRNAAINNESIAIMCNDTIISCPSVNAEITDGNVILSGLSSYEDAYMIATNLNSGNLPVMLTIDSIQ